MIPRGDVKSVIDVKAVDSTDGSDRLDRLSSKQIADSVTALKASVAWPKKEKTPKFNDEAATVYINIVPKITPDLSKIVHVGLITLPHPLSLNRSVCYIGKNTITSQQRSAVEQKLKNEGVLGQITVLDIGVLGTANEDKDVAAFATLAERHDTHLCCPKSFHSSKRLLAKCLAERNKCAFLARDDFKTGLASTALWANPERTGYIFKVGHTGLTDRQLGENVAAAVKSIAEDLDWLFPCGIAGVKAIQLQMGTGEGVAVHRDDSPSVEQAKQTFDADDDWSVPRSKESLRKESQQKKSLQNELQRKGLTEQELLEEKIERKFRKNKLKRKKLRMKKLLSKGGAQLAGAKMSRAN